MPLFPTKMILCKYIDTIGCLDIIKNKWLKASDPATFNDPFEILPGIIGAPDKEKTLRHFYEDLLPKASSAVKRALPGFNGQFILNNNDSAFEKIKCKLKPVLLQEIEKGLERASQTSRIICFCDPDQINEQDDVLLWSHYGDKHRGVRIFFDATDIKIISENLLRVEYSHERASVDLTNPSELFNQAASAYRNILRTKNKIWEYEHEIRWIISLKECIQTEGNSYISFSPGAIQRIDFGCKCEGNKEIIQILRTSITYGHIKLYNAIIHEHKFSLNYKQL